MEKKKQQLERLISMNSIEGYVDLANYCLNTASEMFADDQEEDGDIEAYFADLRERMSVLADMMKNESERIKLELNEMEFLDGSDFSG